MIISLSLSPPIQSSTQVSHNLRVEPSAPSLDLGEPINSSIGLELREGSRIDIDGENHAGSAMALGRLVGLLAVEEARAVAIQGNIKRVQIRDVIGVEVAEVGIELRTRDLGAGCLERGLREGVVRGAEVEVDALALADALDEGRVVDELLVGADEDGDDCGGGRVNLSGTLNEGGAGLEGFWGGGGGGDGSEAKSEHAVSVELGIPMPSTISEDATTPHALPSLAPN